MNRAFEQMISSARGLSEQSTIKEIPLYPGIELFQLSLEGDSISARHPAMEHILQINYCKTGQLVWKMAGGNRIYLNPGDFSLHTMQTCTESAITFPTGQYAGLTLCVDLQAASAQRPELLQCLPDFPAALKEKFCAGNAVAFFGGNEQTESIFSAFYGQPSHLALSYQRLKTLELFLYLSKIGFAPEDRLTPYQSGQIDAVRKIHEYLIRHIDQRITIEELSRQFLINPTTLKAAFKTVYGTSLAAHIKKHRMEEAAKLLRETQMSIAEIAQAVGYDSQSKFSAAFKNSYGVLPKEYQKSAAIPQTTRQAEEPQPAKTK